MLTCLFARTAHTATYPQFISVNEEKDGVGFTVRSPARPDGSCGDVSKAVLTADECLDLARALLQRFGTP